MIPRTGFSHQLVMYQKSHFLAALARSISDTNNEPCFHSDQVDSNRFTQYLNNIQWPTWYCQNHQRENPIIFKLDKVWFVLEIRRFTFPYFPVKSSWSINNRYRRLFLFQRDRAAGVVGVGLYKLDSVHLKTRWPLVTSRLSCEQKMGDCAKSNLKLT